MDLSSYVQQRLQWIEDKLSSLTEMTSCPLLLQASRYCLLNPGKRLRPLLVIAATEALGQDVSKALTPACAIEILHTYSLIHDDLPCMDDDDFRRGKPTLHTLYPEGQAVLTGDLLLTFAFEVLSQSPDLTDAQIVKLVQILAIRSGGQGMIAGQSLDLLAEGKEISIEELWQIHQAKTGALLSACLEFGAVITNAPSSALHQMTKIGEEIGLAFQIVDDILDEEGQESLLGKPTFSDVMNKKATSTSLLGTVKAKELAETLLQSSLDRCRSLEIQDSFLYQLLPRLVYRSY